MSAARQTILRPVGLVTQPNKFGQYVDGALARARNCVMRNPGELDAAPSMFASLTPTGPINSVLQALVPLDAGAVYELKNVGTTWGVTQNGNAATLPGFASTTSLFSATGRISPSRAKDRMLLNSNYGILVGDFMNPQNATERALRVAGLPQLSWRNSIAVQAPTPNGAIPPVSPATNILMVGYQAIHTRTFSDGYKLVSVPTPIVKRFGDNSGVFATSFTQTVSWATSDVALVGDVIELYRSDGMFGLASNIALEPPTVYKLVASVTLTATDIANSFAIINDNSRMGDPPYYSTTGRELYTNPGNGRSGALDANRQPPIAAVTVNFDGRTFYANTTDRPKLQVTVPAGIGSTAFGGVANTSFFRQNGIGNRQAVNATVTNGSAVISNLSAAEVAGLKPGMMLGASAGATSFAPNWTPATPRVVSVGATSVTMSSVWNLATATGQSVWLADALYIGFNNSLTLNPYRFSELGDLLSSFAGLGYMAPPGNLFEIYASFVPAFFANNVGVNAYNAGASFSVEPKNHGSAFVSMQVMATNGLNYSPPLAEYTASPTISTVTQFARTTQKNRVVWSKPQQPEHVNPGDNEDFVGLREIIAAKSTKDAIWFACLDGVFRLTGAGGQYRVDQIDSTKIICGPQAMTTLDEAAYIYTNFGMLSMSSEARNNLTDMVVGDLLPGPEYLETNGRILQANEQDLEILYADVSGGSQIYVYATKEGAGWTTLENNAANLSNVTAIAYQRSPASGDPRVLIGVSPLGGGSASYAGWGNTASFLTMDFAYQPVYADDPMGLKQWVEASYIFDSGNAGKTLRPLWNLLPYGQATVKLQNNAAYARAGIPRDHSLAVSISAGADQVSGAAPQARFLGVSLLYLPLTNTSKQR